MNWNVFNTAGKAPERAFEAFLSHIFERWCQETYADSIQHLYFLDGRGGDGGVEAFAVLKGSVVGLQAKWFPNGLRKTQFGQIQASLSQAVLRHPNLTHYIVCIPKDLSDAKNFARRQKSELDRWKELVAWVHGEYPNVELKYWGDTAIEEQLATHDDLVAYWFPKTAVKLADLQELTNRACSTWFHERYLPDLHCTGQIDQTIMRHLHHPSARKRMLRRLNPVCLVLKDAIRELERLPLLPGFSGGESDLMELVAKGTEEVQALDGVAMQMHDGWSTGSLQATSPPRPQQWSYDAAFQLRTSLEELDKKSIGYAPSHNCRKALDRVLVQIDELASLHVVYAQARRPLAIIGDPGIGKTHAVVACSQFLANRGRSVLLIAARSISPASNWSHILSDAMDVVNWNADEVLSALEAVAHFADTIQRAESPDHDPALGAEPCRVLIAIDGLEESANAQRWQERLRELLMMVQNRPRLVVVCTTRTETTAACLGTTENEFHTERVYAGSSILLGRLFASYCRRYNVDVSQRAWLGWALRTPLAIRLFCELNRGCTVQADQFIVTSIPGLVRKKLQRVESELRQDPDVGWPATNAVLVPVLRAIATSFVEGDVALRHDDAGEIMRQAVHDPNFMNPGRIHHILAGCRIHGILDSWRLPSADSLADDEWYYRPAFNVITDYLVADGAATQHVKELSQENKPEFPEVLAVRPDAAAMVVAMLAHKGRFVVQDQIWAGQVDPEKLEAWQLRAIADLPPDEALAMRDWVREVFIRSMPSCRMVLEALVLPSCRVPDQPYGASFVDEVLRSLSVAQRDLFWSGPDYLPDNHGAPWEGSCKWPLDRIELLPGDEHNGIPLLMAWSCCSLVRARRKEARRKLAEWGGQNPRGMATLIRSVATADDGQMVEDVLVAGSGAAMACPRTEAGLLELANVCDAMFFAEDPQAPTHNAITRHAARVIVERAKVLGYDVSDEMLDRARPPYPLRANDLLPFTAPINGKVDSTGLIGLDLEWYVAPRAIAGFFDDYARSDKSSSEDENTVESFHKDFLQAVVNGSFSDVSSTVRESCRQELDRRSRFLEMMQIDSPAIDTPSIEDDDSVESEHTSDSIDLITALTEPESPSPEAQPKVIYSPEAQSLLQRYASEHDLEDLTPYDLRDGLIVAHARHIGWSHDQFIGEPNGEKPGEIVKADIAIMGTNHPEAHQGSASTVATFREKYIRNAVHVIAGYLADRLPRHRFGEEWQKLLDQSDLGDGMPEPLDQMPDDREPENILPWIPATLLPELPIEAENQLDYATQWLANAPAPDVSQWPWLDKPDDGWCLLSGCIFTADAESTVENMVWIASFGISPEDAGLLRRDIQLGIATHLFLHDDNFLCALGEATYISPSIAAWAPWMSALYAQSHHGTMNAEQEPCMLALHALAAKVIYEARDGEEETWLPAPLLRDALQVIDGYGDADYRKFLDQHEQVVAVHQKMRELTDFTSLVETLVIQEDMLQSACQQHHLQVGWHIRVYRRIPFRLMGEGCRPTPSEINYRYLLLPTATGEIETLLLSTTKE